MVRPTRDHRNMMVAMAKSDAVAEIARNSGTQFDPAIVSAFIRVVA